MYGEAIELAPGTLSRGSHQALVRKLGKAGKARLTIIAEDGTMLADSALTLSELQKAENHGTRPEVMEARGTGRGIASRFSTTVQRADDVPGRCPSYAPTAGACVRVAMTLQDVDALIAHMRWLISGAVLLGLVVAATMGIAGVVLCLAQPDGAGGARARRGQRGSVASASRWRRATS